MRYVLALLFLASTVFAADKMRVSTADIEVCTVDKAGVYARGPAFTGQTCGDYKKTIARASADNDDRFVWLCWLLDPCSSP